MNDIRIKTIPHNLERYPTVGDYFEKYGIIHIKVSDLKDWRYEFLIALHELIEAMLCKKRNISWDSVTEFDLQFEKEGLDGEPGDDPRAPYRKEHFFATNIEALTADQLGVDWAAYEEACNKLYEQ